MAAAAGLGHAADHVHPPPRHVPLLVRRSGARLRQHPARSADREEVHARRRHLPLHPRVRQRPAGRSWDDVWTGPALEGAEKDIGIRWRVEGTEGLARGTIGWPDYPQPTPSTLDFTTTKQPGYWLSPRWNEVWFPDAFVGTMAQLLVALENRTEPEISGADNLKTMALVDACYLSAREHRAVPLAEILDR